MAYSEKKHAWQGQETSRVYDARRFQTPLQRIKHRRDETLVLELLSITSGVRSVLDFPCGTGRFLPALDGAGFAVVGADLSLAMMRAFPRAETAAPGMRGFLGFVQADGERAPFRSNCMDAVLCMRFLFHVDIEDVRVTILRELGRVSEKAVIGQVRHPWTLKQMLRRLRSRVGLSRRYRPAPARATLEAELARAGLELRELRPVSRLFSDKALFLAVPL